MAKVTDKISCIKCGKEKAILKCGGCSDDFCFDHVTDHRQEIRKELDAVEINSTRFREKLLQQQTESKQCLLIQQINQWEQDSIKKIQQTAEEQRQIILQYTGRYIKHIEFKLNKLVDHVKQSKEENDFVETDLKQWTKQLNQLTEELNSLANFTLKQDSQPFINRFNIDIETELLHIPKIDSHTKWIQHGITVAGGNGEGNGVNQLSKPVSVQVDDDQTIYIADRFNHRVIAWKADTKNGHVVAGGNGKGAKSDQLYKPTDVCFDEETDSFLICDKENRRIVRWISKNGSSGQTLISDIDCARLTIDNNGYLYVSDHQKHEVRRWKIGETESKVVAGGNGQGNRLNQLNTPTFIFVDEEQSVYVSDWENNRVMKWLKDAKQGIIVAGGQGKGNNLTQLSSPQGLVVDHFGNVYVADYTNHRVMRWCKGAKQGTIVVGGNGEGQGTNQLNSPQGLAFDHQGNLYVVDQLNHRIQKFKIDSTLNS